MSAGEEYIIWEPEYNHRGTFSILAICVTTLGICVWSSMHLNIPRERPNWWQNLVRKIFWVFIGMIAPEVLIANAVAQYLSAREIRNKVNARRRYNQTAKPTQGTEDYTNKEEYLLSGFDEVVDIESGKDLDFSEEKHISYHNEDTPATRKYVHRWTMVHGFYAVMGGFAYPSQDSFGNVTHTPISPDGFLRILREHPDVIPDISEETIQDKGKSDGLAKTILTLQVGWFCISCISRLIQHLPLTLLEVSTAAHAACSLFVYAIWWNKPLNAADRTLVPYEGADLYPWEEGLFGTETNFTAAFMDKSSLTLSTVFVTIGAIYGAPHFLAWNAGFATHTEQLLWRTCTCVVVGAPIVFSVFYALWRRFDSDIAEKVNTAGFFLSVLVYVPANLYLIGASFRQLFHLPPAAFKLPLWSSYFPHVS